MNAQELYESAVEYVQAGLRIFPLHRVNQGRCECGNQHCMAIGKHPAKSDWPRQPVIDEAVLEVWIDGDMMPPYTGMGWALDGSHIVLDVDPRNGGDLSFAQLQADIGVDLLSASSAVVKTGGKGLHLYFNKPADADLAWKMPDKYPGLDIKQTGGFVVIPGSIHASGNLYEWYNSKKSDVATLTILPAELAKLLARARIERTTDGDTVEIIDIKDMLSYLNPDMGHDDWVKVGMSVHRGTLGSAEGFAAFDEWSSKGGTYNSKEMASRWHSFGKRVANGVTIATLVGMAQSAGWSQKDHLDADMTEKELEWIENFSQWGQQTESTKVAPRPKVTDLGDIDLMRIPGNLSQVMAYIRDKSMFDNQKMSLAATLYTASNVIGRGMHLDGRWANVTPNLILLVVAASATGKESVMGTARELLRMADIGSACHGRIKSDKDLLDSLAANQYANYMIDEFGIFLGRVANSKKSGAHYLEGVIGTIMEVYTKSNSVLLTDISRREAIISTISQEITKSFKRSEDLGGQDSDKGREHHERGVYLQKLLDGILDNGGLSNPWLSMFTTATPSTMADAFTQETVESGFLSRALVFFEPESNPSVKHGHVPPSRIPMGIEMRLLDPMLRFCSPDATAGRIDDHCMRKAIAMDSEAADFLQRLEVYLYEWAEALKAKGMTPLARRAAEMVVKLCITIAGWNQTPVTMEIIRYATRIVLDDLDTKIRKVEIANGSESRDGSDRRRALMLKILDVCQVWASGKEITTRCKSKTWERTAIVAAIGFMEQEGLLQKQEEKTGGRGRPAVRYKCTEAGLDFMASD